MHVPPLSLRALRIRLALRARFLAPIVLTVASCGGISLQAENHSSDAGDSLDGPADAPITLDAFDDAPAPVDDDAGFPPFHDPECSDAGVGITPPINECDPFGAGSGGCLPGEGCYPYVETHGGCAPPQSGAICLTSGKGLQGDACTDGSDCQSGYACVISGSGNQCVKLCSLDRIDPCPTGLVCQDLDVEGYGGCL